MTERKSRAPGRRKPWYRARNVFLAIVLAIAGWIGLEVYRAITARPGTPVNYAQKLDELIRAHQPAGRSPGPETPNAIRILQEAYDIADEVQAEVRNANSGELYVDYSLLMGPERDDIQGYEPGMVPRLRKAGRTALGRLRELGAFEKLEEASRTPASVRPNIIADGPLIQIMLPDLGRSRNMARAMGARMYLASAAGDGEDLARAYEHALTLGRVNLQQSFLIEHLVGYAIVALANGELMRSTTERQWDEETLLACLGALDRQRAWMNGLDVALEAERLSVLDTIQWTHTDDGRGNGRLIMTALNSYTGMFGGAPAVGGGGFLEKLLEYRIGNVVGIAYPSKKATTRKTNEYFDRVIQYRRTPQWQRAAMGWSPDVAVEELSPRHIVLRLLLPALGKSVSSESQHELGIAATRTLLAIEIYRARHGRYPESLSALAPEILPELPRDPYTGGEFAYRLLAPGEDPRGRGYLLYSFGYDRKDDGGVTDERNNWKALSRAGEGLDHVINVPREASEEPEPEPAPPPSPAELPPGEYSTPEVGQP